MVLNLQKNTCYLILVFYRITTRLAYVLYLTVAKMVSHEKQSKKPVAVRFRGSKLKK